MWSTGQLRWKFVMPLASLVNIQSKTHVISEAISVCTRRSTEQIPLFSMLQTRLPNSPANFGSWAPGLSMTIDLTIRISGWSCTAILPSQSFSINSVHVSAKPKGAAVFPGNSDIPRDGTRLDNVLSSPKTHGTSTLWRGALNPTSAYMGCATFQYSYLPGKSKDFLENQGAWMFRGRYLSIVR